MKWVPMSPLVIGSRWHPMTDREQSLPPLLVNPWHVVWIAPHNAETGGCSVILVDGTVMGFRESLETIHNMLKGDLH